MSKNNNLNKKWTFLIDRGGTFTDIIAIPPKGDEIPIKLLSQNPSAYKDAAIEGIRRALKLTPDQPIPNDLIDTIRMGTTVATNALLEQKGEPTILLTSQGLADCLEIGTQARADIFALNIKKPKMLYHQTISLKERIRADGTSITPLDVQHARAVLETSYKEGIRSVAILLIHSYKYPEHEQKVEEIAKQIGYTQISASHKVSPLIKYIPRGDTTMVDAYLSPILHRYTNEIETALNSKQNQTNLLFMTSSGALTSKQQFNGKDAILSGPAGGIVGAAKTAKMNGFENIICFDMGGTSTDVAHFNGEFDISFENEIAGHRLQNPMLHIHTVAAGGGSILSYKNNRMAVGPQSAGAQPGPCSYRGGGPLTITDANLMTGRIHQSTFPSIFGKHQDQPLDKTAVQSAFQKRAKEIDESLSPEAIAEGYIRIANENMAAAIKKVSVERGIDISHYTLQCYGGAGGQHAAAIAEILGIPKVFIHAHSSLLSAYGMGLAERAARRRKMLHMPLASTSETQLKNWAATLIKQASSDLSHNNQETLSTTTTCYLAYNNVETKLPVPLDNPTAMTTAFEQAHKKQFGFLSDNTPIMIEQMEVKVSLTSAKATPPQEKSSPKTTDNRQAAEPAKIKPPTYKTTKIYEDGGWQTALLIDETSPGNATTHLVETPINGPALLVAQHQTIYTPKDWSLCKTTNGHIILEHKQNRTAKQTINTTKPDPIRLELFNNLFMSIAEQMGEALRATAQSVNIKERLDYSCAIFDQHGALIANAPHMPVHLGSMDQAVTSIIKANPDGIKEGDAFMINAPYNGGTHLPDITVITPILSKGDIIAYVAARGHHADIGGLAPGSMSPNATTIHEEGILIENFQLVKNGIFQEAALNHLLQDHKYPARKPAQNTTDLKAQLAACAKGKKELLAAIATLGENVVSAYMGFVQEQAANAVKILIKRIANDKLNGLFEGSFISTTDQAATIKVSITPCAATQTLTIDFTGTSNQTNDNFNAPAPVTRAAVLYVLRTLVDGNIPMNAGCLQPINLIIPEGSILAPKMPAAVAAGNVETSQVVTNCLYGAFGCLGQAQGTMNNLTFGDETYQYYETLCSGAPAGPGFHGSPAIHTHMTNSRLTDPETLETRYPVELTEFIIRKGSGGKGKWCAGDGIRRTLTFKRQMNLALLTGYRKNAIPGTKGGQQGEKGKNTLTTLDGEQIELNSCCERQIKPGESITIKTPTGGGYQKAKT